MSELLIQEFESVAQAMLLTRGNIVEASRMDSVPFNAMALRAFVQTNPEIRRRYHELLSFELQEKGLHIAERILKIAELQEQAFGVEYEEVDPESGVVTTSKSPADPRMVIELSKEISRLIAEGKGQNMSPKAAILLTSKEDAAELLQGFLDS